MFIIVTFLTFLFYVERFFIDDIPNQCNSIKSSSYVNPWPSLRSEIPSSTIGWTEYYMEPPMTTFCDLLSTVFVSRVAVAAKWQN